MLGAKLSVGPKNYWGQTGCEPVKKYETNQSWIVQCVKFAATLLLFDFLIVFVETFCRLFIKVGGNIGQVYSTIKFLIIKIVQSSVIGS